MVRLFAQRFAEEVLVEADDVRVLVGLAQRFVFVLVVKRLAAGFQEGGIAVVQGLPASADASAGASHDFNGMEFGFAFADFVEELPGVAQAVGDADVELGAVEVDGGTLDVLQAAGFLKVHFLQGLAGVKLVCGAEGGFHDASRSAEDDAGTGGFAQRVVEVLVREGVEVDVGTLDEAGKFTGGERIIHVGVAVRGELFAGALVFLSQAGHDGHHNQVFARDAHLLRPIGLGNGAEHLLRGARRGGNVEQVRELVLEEVYPCRAAGGEYRQAHVLVAVEVTGEAVEEFAPFLHDGEVGGEIGVKDFVESQLPQGCHHLAGDGGARRIAELFAQGCPHGWGGLHDDGLLRVVEVADEPVGVIDFGQRTHGAYGDALPAEGAFGIRQVLMEGGGDGGDKAPVDGCQRADGLHFVAHHFAAAAVDALAHVADDGGGSLDGEDVAFSGEGDFPYFQGACQGLQFAVPGLRADEAVVGVVGKDEFEHRAAGVEHAQAAGVYFHAFLAAGGAGGGEVPPSFDFHHADAAGCREIGDAHIFQVHVAKRGNVYPDLPGCFQQGGAFFHFHRVVVYL